MTTLAARPDVTSQVIPPATPSGLLHRHAAQTPNALALLNPPNRTSLTTAAPRRLTYREADTAVDALAAYFAALGLEPGNCVAVQLPNVIESPLTLLGAWRAGLTVAPIPMLWSATELARVCDMLEPAALIGVSAYEGSRPADLLRDVAATRLSVRFVMGFGADLPDGVTSLDAAIADAPSSRFVSRDNPGPSLVTFTARAGASLVPLFRRDKDLLLQGEMAVTALSLDQHDILLNAYPLTGTVGLTSGLMPWLVAGTALVQHDPFDYDVLVQQILNSGASTTALPGAVLDRLMEDSVFANPQCSLRHLGRVWTPAQLASLSRSVDPQDRGVFDLYPLGDLACLIEADGGAERGTVPSGPFQLSNRDVITNFIEAGLIAETDSDRMDIAVRGPVVPEGRPTGPAARNPEGYVRTGLHGERRGERLVVRRDPEILYHGGFTVAASELDGLYQAFPGFLDAACFALSDPVIGDRVFAAIVPAPAALPSLDALRDFLTELRVAPYKVPDQLLVVREIPRDTDGRVLRARILSEV